MVQETDACLTKLRTDALRPEKKHSRQCCGSSGSSRGSHFHTPESRDGSSRVSPDDAASRDDAVVSMGTPSPPPASRRLDRKKPTRLGSIAERDRRRVTWNRADVEILREAEELCCTESSGGYEGISKSAFRGHVKFHRREVKSVSSGSDNGLERCPTLRKSSTC